MKAGFLEGVAPKLSLEGWGELTWRFGGGGRTLHAKGRTTAKEAGKNPFYRSAN